VTYDDSLPWRAVSTANELVLPLGRAVRLELRAADVAHSFWAPSLAGPRDAIPGRPATLWLRAERLGTYAARCATYCGTQHAHMGLTVTVVTPFDFYAWLDSAGRPAREPQTATEQRGHDLFVAGSCARCHTIIGTDALGSRGPDLTHLASRPTLAAGTLPNTAEALAAFIADPERLKPGARMPPSALAPDDLRAVVEYLASLR
jgi:cytochrome c oxidase subunit 2